MQNAIANSKLIGSGSAGIGVDYVEINLGTNLSMVGTTLNATGGGVTNLAFDNRTATQYDITSDTGTDATVTAATGTLAGAMVAADKVKVDFITVTQAVDLDTIESDTATNNAKVTNATHTGDVTGATVLTIADNAVTNAKSADVSTNTIKGRITAGTGDPEDLTPANVRTIINVEDGATANSTDAFLLARANHTGTQTLSTISNSGALAALDTVGTAEIDASAVTNTELADMVQKTIKGRADAAGTGAPTDLSPAQVRDVADLNTTDNVTFNNVTLPNAPTVGTDGVNKTYADAIGSARTPKDASIVTTTQILDSNTSISGSPSYNNVGGSSARGQITATLAVSDTFTVDGVSFGAAEDGTRFLIKNEGDGGGLGGDANGIYTSTISGTSLTLDRATDFDADVEVTNGASTIIGQGSVNAAREYVLTTPDPITIGGVSGTSLTFINASPAASPTNITISRTATTVDVESSTGSNGTIAAADGTNAGVMVSANFTKLAGIEAGATLNSTDAFLLARANHTGTQTLSTISDSGTLAGLNTVGTSEIDDNAVTNAKLANVLTATLKGRITAGTGDPEDLTTTQARTILNVEDGATANSSDATLLNRANHTGTQLAATISDFDSAVSGNSSVTANTAKVTNATHTGEVTGSSALTVDKTVITNQTTVTAGTGDFVLVTDASDTDNLKKVNASDFLAGGDPNTVTQTNVSTANNLLVKTDGTTRVVQESGIVISDGDTITGDNIEEETAQTTSFTITGAMSSKHIELDSALDVTVTFPQQSTEALDSGYYVTLTNKNVGVWTIAVEGTDTLDGNTTIEENESALIKLDAAGSPQTITVIGAHIIIIDNLIRTVDTVANQDFTVLLSVQQPGKVTSISTQADAGTCTLTGKVNATALGGIANSVSTSLETQPHTTTNTFLTGDKILFTISANSGCTGMFVQVSIEYT